ncbi:MAG: NAD(P)-dependent oxidoreductase [Acidimicrobiales bacterium]|nr:NAD(P)-dependent oxidoreductase [Acidimicrobiales bacterium]
MSAQTAVLVTGAAGRLGRTVSSLLHREGYNVAATDIVDAGDVSYAFRQADLLDHEVALGLLEGIDVLVHLGNHPGFGERPPQVVFNENTSINANMFQGAAEGGVERIVFASTLQLVGSHIDERTVLNRPALPNYPLDGETVPDPSNLYALSKTVSEVMLRYYATRCGIDCVALRFPLLHNNETSVAVASGEECYTDILEGFSGLTYRDAADLFLAVLRADLPGYRVYMPGTSHRHRTLAIPDLLRTHYPSVPPSLPDLIDVSKITEETGWKPSADYRSKGRA